MKKLLLIISLLILIGVMGFSAVTYFRAEEIPAEEIPAEEIPAEEIPAEEIPVEEEPEAVVEKLPAEEVPVEEKGILNKIEEIMKIRRRARITTMKAKLFGLWTIIIMEEETPSPGTNFCINAEVDEIERILDDHAGTVTCYGMIDGPATCIEVDGVLQEDDTYTTLCGDSKGNLILGGRCLGFKCQLN